MAATKTLQVGTTFPDGTSVGAYPASAWSGRYAIGTPIGAATNTQTVAAGAMTFTGLLDDTDYYASGQVSGTYRYIGFNTRTVAKTITPTANTVGTATITDGSIMDADVNAAAAIAESKLTLASDAAAGTASRRTLGAGALQATAGTDARLSDTRTPAANSVALSTIPAATIDATLPWRIQIPAWTGKAAGVGTFASVPLGVLGGGYHYNTSIAQNDSMSWDVVMAAGTWTMEIRYGLSNGGGIVTPSIAGANQATFDSYAASAAYDQLYTAAGIVNASTAKKRVTLLAGSKNASSVGYYIVAQWISLIRTA